MHKLLITQLCIYIDHILRLCYYSEKCGDEEKNIKKIIVEVGIVQQEVKEYIRLLKSL